MDRYDDPFEFSIEVYGERAYLRARTTRGGLVADWRRIAEFADGEDAKWIMERIRRGADAQRRLDHLHTALKEV